MKAQFVAGELLDLLEDGERYPVHSGFTGGFNLKAGPFLGFVGNKRGERMPFGIVLRSADAALFTQWVRPGQTVFAWDAAAGRLTAGDRVLELSEAVRYESGAGRIALPADALALFDAAVDLSEATGLQATVGMLSNPERPGTAELCRCFGSRDGKRIRMTLKKWVGCGLGLTPSGDDFLTGVLLTDTLAPFLTKAFRGELEAMAGEGYTTDIGASYCRCALRGLFCGSLRDLAEALGRGDAAKTRDSMGRVLRFGHTSGRDTAAGIRLGLQCLGRSAMAESA